MHMHTTALRARERFLPHLILGFAVVLTSACGRPDEPAQPAPAPDATTGATTPAADTAAPAAAMPRQPAPADAKVRIVSPADGATVGQTFTVTLEAEGVAIVPAGDPTPDSGHHHLLIDVPLPADAGQPLPTDANHVHLGKAQTEVEITLSPGTHTLQAVLGDMNHVPHDPPVVSERITVTVE